VTIVAESKEHCEIEFAIPGQLDVRCTMDAQANLAMEHLGRTARRWSVADLQDSTAESSIQTTRKELTLYKKRATQSENALVFDMLFLLTFPF
jgi:hypothetical protein